jgi:hypothetical protein
VSLVYDHTPGGLLVAREAADAVSIQRALKSFDPRLMLDYAIDPDWGRLVWQVLCKTGGDTPPSVVCRWRGPDGEPLPLSHGLVEQAKRLHAESRAPKPDVLAENDRRTEQVRAEAEAELDDIGRHITRALKGNYSAVFPRGPHLRRRQGHDVTDVR